ncbi:MAG: hypothetical protein ACR2H3_03885 [Acidimicrobiales bacterium]
MSDELTKGEIVHEIAVLLGVPTPRMSTGSTEPREIFDLVNDSLGLGVVATTKPDLAKGIVEASGERWLPDFDSRGGTVTKDGLLAVLRSVRFFVGG